MTHAPQSHPPDVLAKPVAELGRLARFIGFQARLWARCARWLKENKLATMSAALSFRTIFALIPALVLVLVAASAFGFLEDSKRSLRTFLEASGFAQLVVPESAASQPAAAEPTADVPPTSAAAPHKVNVAEEMERVVEQVQRQLTLRRIGPVGMALFIWTALSLLTTVEDSLNRVFRAARSRSVARRVLLYWSMMTLGPLLLAVAMYLGRRGIELAQHVMVLSQFMVLVGSLGPVLVGVVVLAGVYVFVPNARVRRRAALGGALVAVLLWLVAKWAFSLYVERFVLGGNLYGILGAFPLFMMWLNLSWMIFLFGAELAHMAASLGRGGGDAETSVVTPLHAVFAALTVARLYQAGQGPVSTDQLAAQLQLAPEASRWLLSQLARARILCPVSGDDAESYILARPPQLILVKQALSAVDAGAPTATAVGAGALAPLRDCLAAGVGNLTLAHLLTDSAPAEGSTGPASLAERA